jgi:DNA-directed RNA polymerase subunit D
MELQILEKDDNSIKLIVRGVNTSFMNSIRRIALTEVPSMAIDEVVMVENSSVLHDEILAHRLGLIPLSTDLDSYNLPEECSCESEFGCNLCSVALDMDVEAVNGVKTAYSGDLESRDPGIQPVSNKIPIVKLVPEQKVKFEAYARLGKGKKHAKWQPVSVCAYKYLPIIKIDESKCNNCDECTKICSKRIIHKVNKKIKTRNEMECTLCNDCVDACPQEPSAINVTWEKDSYIFSVESTNALSIDRILIEALNILDKKTDLFLSQLNEIFNKGD